MLFSHGVSNICDIVCVRGGGSGQESVFFSLFLLCLSAPLCDKDPSPSPDIATMQKEKIGY